VKLRIHLVEFFTVAPVADTILEPNER